MYYKGSDEFAFESIQFIMSKVQFGWLIRSIHSWTANLFILTAMIHMFSVFFEKSVPQAPRDHLVHRYADVLSCARLRVQRVSVAVE